MPTFASYWALFHCEKGACLLAGFCVSTPFGAGAESAKLPIDQLITGSWWVAASVVGQGLLSPVHSCLDWIQLVILDATCHSKSI